MKQPQILPLGPDGILVRFADTLDEASNRAALAFRAGLDDAVPNGVTETASSLTSVFIRFDPAQTARQTVEAHLSKALNAQDWSDAKLPPKRKIWHIPACFEGEAAPDLETVAQLAGVSAQDAIAEITARPLRVLALGFAPGQPYLGFLPQNWNIPRQSEVTPKVPQGAVVVAVRQVIPFANAAPTGWRQIGRTAFRCYDPEGTPALPLAPGDEVRFQPVPSLSPYANDMRGGAESEAIE